MEIIKNGIGTPAVGVMGGKWLNPFRIVNLNFHIIFERRENRKKKKSENSMNRKSPFYSLWPSNGFLHLSFHHFFMSIHLKIKWKISWFFLC